MNTLEERVARLEQAFADTKEVLLLLRDDIRRIDGKIDGVEQKLSGQMNNLEQKLSARIEAETQELNSRIDDLEQKLGARIEGEVNRLDHKIDGLEQKLGARMDRLEAAMQRLTFWILGTLASTIIMFITLLLRRP